MCECSSKGTRANPILTYLCDYHRNILKTKGIKAFLKEVENE